MMTLALRSSFGPTSKGFLTCGKILRHGADGFTSPPKEGVLRIFIALKNTLPSAYIKPANLGSIGKHASHYTTEDDFGVMIPHHINVQALKIPGIPSRDLHLGRAQAFVSRFATVKFCGMAS
jgi:hypothetical protein